MSLVFKSSVRVNVSASDEPIQSKDIPFFFFFAVLDLHCCVAFSLVMESKGYSLVAIHGLLMWWLLVAKRSNGPRVQVLRELQLPGS